MGTRLSKDTIPKLASGSLNNITISLTRSCNQHCEHCWISAGGYDSSELDDGEIRGVLASAKALGAQHVKFTGGEPFIRPGLGDIILFAAHLGFRVSVETNGTLITPPLLNSLHSASKHLHFYISLDGDNPTTHDKFRGSRGAFETTLNTLRLLRDKGFYFSINTVVTLANVTEVKNVFAIAKGLGATQHKLILTVHNLGRGSRIQGKRVTSRRLFDLLAELPKQRLWDYQWDPARSRRTTLMTTLPPAFQPDDRYAATCGWSQSFLAVLSNGDVAICHGLYGADEAIAGNIREQPLADIWQRGSLFTESRKWTRSEFKGICSNCAVAETCRGLCRANAFSEYGDLRAPYPLCQTLYEEGVFPTEMLVDPDIDTSYHPDTLRSKRASIPTFHETDAGDNFDRSSRSSNQ